MYWRLHTETIHQTLEERGFSAAGRFVLHRHHDAAGAHLDLRIESKDALHGWRIEAENLAGEVWATEKRPHSKRWLDETMPALESGVYAVERESVDEAVLLLEGRHSRLRVHAQRAAEVPATCLGSIMETLRAAGANLADAAKLIEDGLAARTRAVARLCGLGRELDGTTFEETVWRKVLRGLSLDEIHAQLRAFEVRFDRRYPAMPVSRPEKLSEEAQNREAMAMEILRS